MALLDCITLHIIYEKIYFRDTILREKNINMVNFDPLYSVWMRKIT